MHFAFLFVPPVARAQDSLPGREEAAIRAAVERVADSVVQIRTIGGLDTIGRTVLADGPTTGLIVSADGYIVSSAFNFVQQPASILVTLPDGRQAPAELVANDHSRMLVLLKVSGAADLPVPELAPADDIRVGQWAIALGRTFRADRPNVSVGIVSAVGRMYGKVLQTDAAVSTANYGGPLIDIRGRVLGVLVPMAPQAASEVAGVEWYDSGIGFAAPLAEIGPALERMKRGEDQHAGILGIGMRARNSHATPAVLSVVRPDGPAGRAGLQKDDRIVEVDGRTIKTQADLRFAVGPRYGGESVRVVVLRGEERVEETITLAGKLAPFRHAFLGILPIRTHAAGADQAEAGDDETEQTDVADSDGITVRMVYPGGPAAVAGVGPGDRLVEINGAPIADVAGAIEQLNNVLPGEEVAIRVHRADEKLELTLVSARLPTSVPNELPPAYNATGEAQPNEGETRELKLPEFPQTCQIYVPAAGEPARKLGVLLWLHAAGEPDAADVIRRWRAICDRDGLLLVVPTAAEAGRWERTELVYLRRLVERVMAQFDVDSNRVVVAGTEGGGAMAYLLGLSGRDAFSGIATSAAPLPRQIRVPENEPAQRLGIFAGLPGDHGPSSRAARSLQQLVEAGYPVTVQTTLDSSSALSDTEREQLARWIDTLDRF